MYVCIYAYIYIYMELYGIFPHMLIGLALHCFFVDDKQRIRFVGPAHPSNQPWLAGNIIKRDLASHV